MVWEPTFVVIRHFLCSTASFRGPRPRVLPPELSFCIRVGSFLARTLFSLFGRWYKGGRPAFSLDTTFLPASRFSGREIGFLGLWATFSGFPPHHWLAFSMETTNYPGRPPFFWETTLGGRPTTKSSRLTTISGRQLSPCFGRLCGCQLCQLEGTDCILHTRVWRICIQDFSFLRKL